MIRFALVAVVAALFTGCAEPHSVMVKRPQDKNLDSAITAMWSHEIHNVAQDGDWILTRSYYMVADGISVMTRGEDLSHASIYDAQKDTIIEAVGDGVREIPLSELIQRNHYVIVVRPRAMSAAERRHSVNRARSRIGTPFDTAGLFGIDQKDAVYCSELVWWAAQGELRTGDEHTVITPSELMKYGEVVYWSGKRSDTQIQALALQ